MKEDNIKKLIDFSLEITQGCQFNCTGCTIDKVHNDYPSDNQFEKIMSLIDDLKENEFKPMNIQIGPTDVMTASNMDKVLTDERVKKLTKKFLKTAINCAFLKPFDEDYVKFGKKLNWLLKGGLVKFIIPFEAYHIDNKEYLNRIRRRIKITLDNMPDVVHTKTYLIMNYEATSIYDREEKKNLTEKLILKTHESDLLEGFDVGFNLAHSLLDLRKPENAKKLYDSVVNLKNYFVNAKRKYDDRIDKSVDAHKARDKAMSDKIEKDSKALLNTHKQKFIRSIEDLVKDIKSASQKKKFGDRNLSVVDPKIF